MFRYQILIEYVLTNFRGWQVQKKVKLFRDFMRKNFKSFKEKNNLFGLKRTDTGVHAFRTICTFLLPK